MGGSRPLRVGIQLPEVEREVRWPELREVDGDVPRRGGPPETGPPVRGTAEEMAGALRALADARISHVQLVVDPITVASIERLGAVLEALRRDG